MRTAIADEVCRKLTGEDASDESRRGGEAGSELPLGCDTREIYAEYIR